MKIALITIHWANNYGAALQVFATVQVLKEFGEVSLIDYRSEFTCKGMTLIRVGSGARDILRIGKDIFRLVPRYRVIKKFKRFNHEFLNMTKIISTDQDFKEINDQYDVFVSGSDQIWNPKIVNEKGLVDSRYFLDFVVGKKKISYASSIGTYVYSNAELPNVKNLLEQYSNISVREKDSAQYLTKLLKRPVMNVLDPTFLLNKKQWMRIFKIEESHFHSPYLLIYALKKDKLLKMVVHLVAKILNIRVVTIDQDPFVNFRNDQHIRDAGPEEFIRYFINARYVVTNSFHGTCFAVNFNIPFIVTTPSTGINRIESLLTAIGIVNRIVSDGTKISALVENKIDYKSINKKLNCMKVESMTYIKKAIK